MARQWVSAIAGVAVHEVGTEEYMVPVGGFAFQENQVTFVPYPNPRYAMQAGMQPMAGGMQ
jgi:hypothetical protein